MDLVLLNLTDSLRLEKKLSLPIAKNTIENHMTFLIEGNNMMPSKTYTLDLHDVVMFEVSVTLGNIPGNLLISSEKKGWETTFSPTQLNGETVWLDQDNPPHFGRGNPQIHESAQEVEAANLRRKTKPLCPQGHEYSTENTYIRPSGWRECRTCRADREATRPARSQQGRRRG